MEQIIAAKSQTLISSLDFSQKDAPIADYITSRQSIKIFSVGQPFKSNGVKLIRIPIQTTGAFVDMSTFTLSATVRNNDQTNALQLLGGSLGCMMQEGRVYLSNIETERVSYMGRTEAMLERFLPWEKRVMRYNQGFGYESGNLEGNFVSTSIDAHGTTKALWSPMSLGICQQKNYLPVAFLTNCIVELLLCGTGSDCCNTDVAAGVSGSTNWQLEDVVVLCDVVNVQSSLLTSLSKFLLGGGNLTLAPKLYSTTLFSIGSSPDAQIVHARAYTRLNSAFISFWKSAGVGGDHPGAHKAVNTFYLDGTHGLSLQTMCGERAYPDHRCADYNQFWMRLLMALGIHNSGTSINIMRPQCLSNSFIAAVDFESTPGQASHSGLSTHNAQLVFDLKNISDADIVYVCCFHDSLISIEQDGCSVAI